MKIYYSEYKWSVPKLIEIEVDEKPKTYTVIHQTGIFDISDKVFAGRLYKNDSNISLTMTDALQKLLKLTQAKVENAAYLLNLHTQNYQAFTKMLDEYTNED